MNEDILLASGFRVIRCENLRFGYDRGMQAEVLGFPVQVESMAHCLAQALDHVVDNRTCHVVTLNPEMIMQAERDAALARVLKSAELVLPDGAGVVWALRLFGYRQAVRLPGIEFSQALLEQAAVQGLRVALIGSKAEVLADAMANLKGLYPGLSVVYSHDGYFQPGPDDEAAIAQACAQAAPQIVLLGLGVPRQEHWIATYRGLFSGAVLVGVGGSFDVWSGHKRRAPDLFLRLNLEWLYRISSEPWRIQRTYKPLPMFVVKVLKAYRQRRGLGAS